MERRLATARQDLVTMREKQKQEIERLSEVLRRETMDRKHAESEVSTIFNHFILPFKLMSTL